MQKNDCFFCDLPYLQKKPELILETDSAYVWVDDDWALKGHTDIVWKNHVRNISALTEDEYVSFSRLVHQTEKALLHILTVEKALILKSGGLVDHLHFHIYPVPLSTPWQEIKDIFDKKVRYNPTDNEKTEFLKKLKKTIGKSLS